MANEMSFLRDCDWRLEVEAHLPPMDLTPNEETRTVSTDGCFDRLPRSPLFSFISIGFK